MTATITVHGGLTDAPELRFSQSGIAILSGTVASTERYKDKNQEWQDGKSLYLRFSAFKDLAENIAATGLEKGSQVVVTGKLNTRSYDDREGNKRSSVELEVTDFAVSLKRATAQVTRTASTGTRTGDNSPSGESYPSTEVPTSQNADSWNTPANDSETPF